MRGTRTSQRPPQTVLVYRGAPLRKRRRRTEGETGIVTIVFNPRFAYLDAHPPFSDSSPNRERLRQPHERFSPALDRRRRP